MWARLGSPRPPACLLTAVVAGVYLPGLVFSFLDVFVTKRLTLAECRDVHWRAMKWYGSFYPVAWRLRTLRGQLGLLEDRLTR